MLATSIATFPVTLQVKPELTSAAECRRWIDAHAQEIGAAYASGHGRVHFLAAQLLRANAYVITSAANWPALAAAIAEWEGR